MKKLVSALAALSICSTNIASTNNVTAKSYVKGQIFYINTPVSIKGEHDIYLHNPTGAPRFYEWSYQFCMFKDTICDRTHFTRTLAAGETYTEHHQSIINVTFRNMGMYPATALTVVYGDTNSSHQMSALMDIE